MIGKKIILRSKREGGAIAQDTRPATPDEILAEMTHGDITGKRDATPREIRRALGKGLPEHYLGQETEPQRKPKNDGGILGWKK